MIRYIYFLLNGLHKNNRGSALIEYAVILAFVVVLAVLFSTEFVPEIPEDDWKNMVGKNMYTDISIIISKVWRLLYTALDMTQ